MLKPKKSEIYKDLKKELYNILGVDPSCSKKELKTAFRKLAAQHHPDKGGDDSRTDSRFFVVGKACSGVIRELFGENGSPWSFPQ